MLHISGSTRKLAARRRLIARCVWLVLSTGVLLLASGCDLRPGTATIFRIGGKRQINHVTLQPPASDENRKAIKLKFTDDNTFQTNDYLTAGRYRLVMRTEEGMSLDADVDVTPEKWYYKIPEVVPSASKGGAVAQPTVSAGISLGDKGEAVPPQIIMLFVGSDVVMRRVAPEGGRVSVDAPGPGLWRVEIIAPGNPPRTATLEAVKITGGATMNLGDVVLR